jgi:hypothetical protein
LPAGVSWSRNAEAPIIFTPWGLVCGAPFVFITMVGWF